MLGRQLGPYGIQLERGVPYTQTDLVQGDQAYRSGA